MKWLKRELIAVLALGVVGLGSILTMAGTAGTSTLNVSVLPAGGETVTITAPNGGESWESDSVQNITWTASGTIANVMIEVQRVPAGSWETVVASTINDGSYPWTVTEPATTTAVVRISKVGDPSVADTSDAVFTVTVSAVVPPTSGGTTSGSLARPAIDNVVPSKFSNQTDTLVRVDGVNFASTSKFYLGNINIPINKLVSWNEVELLVPAGMGAGQYTMSVYNRLSIGMTWGGMVEIFKPADFYAAKLVGQSERAIDLSAGQTATVWVEYQNTGTLPWVNYGKHPVRLGTSGARDRASEFRNWWWPYNRPTAVRLSGVVAGRSVVQPGEVGRFTFTIKAPRYSGSYTEVFEPVVEFIQWMDGSVKLQINVAGKTNKITTPVVVDGEDRVVQPTESLVGFRDGFEAVLQAIANFFKSLIGGFFRM